jgi:putative transposase
MAIWSSSRSAGVLDDGMFRYCERVMRKVCGDFETDLREFSGETDHVHLLVNYPPKVSVSALVNSLKGVPAGMLRSQYTGPANQATINGHFWSPSCLGASCAGAPLSTIRQYIEQQHPA